jgi:DNA-binding CsgD family transcriptional regulator
MIHLAVFGYLFVIMTGVVCMTVAFTLYLKIKSKLLSNFLVYFSAFTLFVFFYLLVLTYINANDSQIAFPFIVTIVALILLSYSFLIYSILHFGHFLINKHPSKRKQIFEISISAISLISIASSIRIDWDNSQIIQQMNLGLLLSYALLFFAILYIAIIKMYNRGNVQADIKQIYMRTSILNIVFIPGFVLDYYLIKSFHFSLFIPLYYLCYSILFLQYFIKTYRTDLISSNSPTNIDELNDYLNRAGISPREKEIITLIMKGDSNKKISNQLFISLSTVKTHVSNIFQKLNVESRFEIMSKINKS